MFVDKPLDREVAGGRECLAKESEAARQSGRSYDVTGAEQVQQDRFLARILNARGVAGADAIKQLIRIGRG
jgi:hypothetical protein